MSPAPSSSGKAAPTVKGLAIVTRPLSGSPDAPFAEGEPGLVSVESRDRAGRLVMLGWAPSKAAKTEGAATDGGGSAPKEKAKSQPALPPTASSVADLVFYDIGRDSAGLVVSLSERKGGEGGSVLTSYRRDEKGRLIGVERREKGELTAKLSLYWEGSGRRAHLSLLDGKGLVAGGATLDVGSGGIADRTVQLLFVDEKGAAAGGLNFAWDAGGRLSRWEARPAPKPAMAAGSDAGSPVPDASTSPAAGPTRPGVGDLLFPIWPRDEASFELFSALTAPFGQADFKAFAAAGPAILPFERPNDGAVDFLWDGQGRLLESRKLDAAGQPSSAISFRYDKRGLLVGESQFDLPGGPDNPGVELLFVYRLDARSTWSECSCFVLTPEAGAGGASPLIWFGRGKFDLPLPDSSKTPSTTPSH